MNIGDALSTYYWVTNGVAEELNPIALMLLNLDPIVFLLVKCIFGSACLLILWLAHEKYKKIIMIVTSCWSFVYFLIFSYHIKFILDYYNIL